MTFTIGHVEGGTHAGWKRQKPKPAGWMCACGGFVVHHGYMVRCPDCGAHRDNVVDPDSERSRRRSLVPPEAA